MAKRIFMREDEGRTELLGHGELFVEKGEGSDTYYSAWLHDPEIESCPRCGNDAIKTQDLFSKTYWDLVRVGEKKEAIQLEYKFYKYRCLKKDCGHVFSKPVHFASRRDNVKHSVWKMKLCSRCSKEPVMHRLQTSYLDQSLGKLLGKFSIDGCEKRKLAVRQQNFLLSWRFYLVKRIDISIQYF